MTHMPATTNRIARSLLTAAAAAYLFAGGGALHADELKIDNIQYKDVRVVGFRNGLVYYATAAGERNVALERVQAMKIDRYPDLGTADEAISAGKWTEAVASMEKAIGAVREDDLKQYMQFKMIYCLDQAGRYGEALNHFLALMPKQSTAMMSKIAPRKLPPSEADRKAALTQLKAATAAAKDAESKQLLGRMVESLEASLASKSPDTPAPTTPQPPDSPGLFQPENQAVRDPIQDLIDAKKYDEALKAIDAALKRERATLSQLLYQRGLAEAGLKRHKDAALSFMRVVIHFPLSDRVTPSLIGAGQMFVELNAPEQARKVWLEAIDKAGADPQVVAKIDQLLATLDKK